MIIKPHRKLVLPRRKCGLTMHALMVAGGTAIYPYWRLHIAALSTTSSAPSIAEFGLATAFDGGSILTGGASTAESVSSGSFAAGNAFDLDTGTAWRPVTGHVPTWVRHQLSTGISDISVVELVLNQNAVSSRPTDFSLYKSVDGINETLVGRWTPTYIIGSRYARARLDAKLGFDCFGQMCMSGVSISAGQQTATVDAWAGGQRGVGCLASKTGKRVWEVMFNTVAASFSGVGCGVTALQTANAAPGSSVFNGTNANCWVYRRNSSLSSNSAAAYASNGGANTSYGSAINTGDVVGVVWDQPNGTLRFYKNGSDLGVAFASGVTGTLVPHIATWTASDKFTINLAGPFAFAASYPGDAAPYDS